MRNVKPYVFFLLLLAAVPGLSQPQHASVSVSADSGFPFDPRPFGKYLAQICTISGERPVLTCTPVQPPERPIREGDAGPPIAARQLDQTITMKLGCDPSSTAPCNPQYPLEAGADFFVAATADSGQPVQQTVLSGSATPVGGSGVVHYRANAPGLIVVRATAAETPRFAEAAPVDILLQVVADTTKAASTCAVIPSAPTVQATVLDAPTIVSLMGNPTPFVLAAQGPKTIAIYSTRQPLHLEERAILRSFQETIATLAGHTAASLGITPTPAKPFSVELTIPHGAALGDLATWIGGMNYSQFTFQDVGKDAVRVVAPAQPDCDTWTQFLKDIRRMEWNLVTEPMSSRLFYLSSSDLATAFTGLAPATPAAGAAPAPAAGSPANITVTQPPGTNLQINSDTTPCVIAGLAVGNTSPCGSPAPTASATAATPAVTPAPSGPLSMASVAVAMAAGEQTPPDLLVFSDTNPGDDAQIQERLRVIAQLDLPRPEMIINAWVMQNSSANQQAMGAFSNMVKGLVAEYDQQFESVVMRGWDSVKRQSADPAYFDEPFRSYIEDRFVADTFKESKPGKSLQEMSQAFLENSQAKLADPIEPQHRTDLGICERGRYCLGYNDLFKPVKPALTDLLLTIIAARSPVAAAEQAITDVEGPAAPVASEANCDVADPQVRNRCHAIWLTLDLDHVSPPPQTPSCADRDYRRILGSLLNPGEYDPRVHLQCFRDQAEILLQAAPEGATTPPYTAGLMRSAIADFLFNYKMSQQYPHEFNPYDLRHSADALNNALSPLIDAFNRDLTSYQLFVRADMQYRVERLNSRSDGRCCVKRLFGIDKPSFFNDGLITVRTISGQWTYVNTTSQSFLNGSTAPQLNSLLSSLGGANPNASGAGSLASAVLAGNPLKRTEALAGALANYQTTFAQIGRSLQISAIPRSLNTASSAEIAVTLNADESAGGPTYTGGGAGDPSTNTSRVANHDTATRVRVDSVKLFELSSFSAIVERSRSRFPLLPPFVEIPYIGTFAGVPIGAAKEFHSSTAVLSAYVVPTAADIANGLRFVPDLVVDGLNPGPCSFFKGAAGPNVADACVFRRALSLKDLDGQPVRNFNQRMVRCLATSSTTGSCSDVTFDLVPKY